ncbi:hypothetical protein CWB72_19900, partial [Pseudoalteromonas phenolica]|uniref:hypothetical protein n=1 Tax=Pseudoalteromonas phenolica TaxID=161398 RepID=UPI0012870EBC
PVNRALYAKDSLINKLLRNLLIPLVGILLLVCFTLFLTWSKVTLALVTASLFVLFSAEHTFNFIGRSDVPFFKKIAGSMIQKIIAFLIPVVILFAIFGVFGI